MAAWCRFVVLARRAGLRAGKRDEGNSYAALVLTDELTDDERQRLGYATHGIACAIQSGQTPLAVWQNLQCALGAERGKPLELIEADNVQLGVLAFAAGACANDEKVSTVIGQYIQGVLSGRQFTITGQV